MTTTHSPLIRFSIGVVLVAVGVAFYCFNQSRKSAASLAAIRHQNLTLQEKVRQLETHLALTNDQLRAAEKNASSLQLSLEQAAIPRPQAPTPNMPITKGHVDERYKNARALAAAGKHAEALNEFLWCYDEGMAQIPSYTGVRQSFLLSDIVKLSTAHPLALTALQERRDKAQQQLGANPDDTGAAMNFSNLNRVLKESGKTLQFYDQLPSDSPGKQAVARFIYNELASAQRYQEAAQAKPYRQMLLLFEDIAEVPNSVLSTPDGEKTRAIHLAHATKTGAGFVEVLAGAGHLEDARDLAAIITAHDTSSEARAALNAAVAKAGHANLFAPPSTAP